jgi:hypothetical protein
MTELLPIVNTVTAMQVSNEVKLSLGECLGAFTFLLLIKHLLIRQFNLPGSIAFGYPESVLPLLLQGVQDNMDDHTMLCGLRKVCT